MEDILLRNVLELKAELSIQKGLLERLQHTVAQGAAHHKQLRRAYRRVRNIHVNINQEQQRWGPRRVWAWPQHHHVRRPTTRDVNNAEGFKRTENRHGNGP